MLGQYEIAVWWATSVEMRSAFERLLRMGQLTLPEHAAAGLRLEKLRRGWARAAAYGSNSSAGRSFPDELPLEGCRCFATCSCVDLVLG